MAEKYYETVAVERAIMDDLKSQDLSNLGAQLGGVFTNTKELHSMKYKKSMKTSDKTKWLLAV